MNIQINYLQINVIENDDYKQLNHSDFEKILCDYEVHIETNNNLIIFDKTKLNVIHYISVKNVKDYFIQQII